MAEIPQHDSNEYAWGYPEAIRLLEELPWETLTVPVTNAHELVEALADRGYSGLPEEADSVWSSIKEAMRHSEERSGKPVDTHVVRQFSTIFYNQLHEFEMVDTAVEQGFPEVRLPNLETIIHEGLGRSGLAGVAYRLEEYSPVEYGPGVDTSPLPLKNPNFPTIIGWGSVEYKESHNVPGTRMATGSIIDVCVVFTPKPEVI